MRWHEKEVMIAAVVAVFPSYDDPRPHNCGTHHRCICIYVENGATDREKIARGSDYTDTGTANSASEQ